MTRRPRQSHSVSGELAVVVGDPGIERGLQLLDRGVAAVMVSQELRPHRLVPPFNPPGRGLRLGCGQQVSDSVLGAEPVEQNLRGQGGRPEPAR